MSGYEQAMTLLAVCGILTAIVGLALARQADRLDREIAERKAAQHPAE
ncbi:MAG: hypothetical protein JNJ73_20520 [Hyphomonadaceae bacterium]|nr:hypothetical protein [Hyphomonadaceae bacterium]